jgi:glycosyltransferase involved in cell wall biosynthesis
VNHRWLVDLQATQSQAHADRGVARYVKEQVRALERLGVGDALLLNPHLPFPRALDQDLLTSPRLGWGTQTEVRRLAEADDRPIGFFLTSPFELSLRAEGDLPPHLLRGDVPVVATLYDLIPLVMPERYLADPMLARRYRGRVEQVHHVDLVLTISEHTRRDAIRLLGLDPATVVSVGFGVSPFFRPAGPEDAPDVLLARHVPALRRPFVAAVLGGDPRKNAERLFAAWARVGRRDHQLVVTCSLDPGTRATWEAAVKEHELALGDDVLLTGWQPDEVLRAIYQRCDLFVFPSLYEGAGLPLAEAVACGAPALTSATSSMPEVLDLAEATFDPTSVEDMAALIERALTDSGLRDRLRQRGADRAALLTWDAVARRTADALATIPASGPTRLPWRLALVGPMPPTESGIADYNGRLLPALADRCEVDVFTPGAAPPYEVHPNVRWFPPRALKETCSPWAYDAVVYTAGNSEHHHDLYDLAQEFPGLLWLHDVRLPGLYTTFAKDRLGDRWEDFLRERLLRQYRRRLPLHLLDDVDFPPGHLNEFGLGLTKELVDVARGVVVSSELAGQLLALDQQPDARPAPRWVLPLAVPEPWADDHPRNPASILCPGMVSPIKGTELLVSALAALRARGVDATLTFAGPVDDGYRADVQRHIDAVGMTDHVTITGRVTDDEYRRWLATATVATILRLTTNGESSAAVTDCLAAGLPVVTNVHAAAELPAGTVSLVPWDVDPAGLADHLAGLLAEPGRRDALAEAGQAYARGWGFAQVADELLRVVAELA